MNYFLQRSIEKVLVFGDSLNLSDERLLHITYGTDKKYQCGVAISIVSILINNPKKKYVFHIYTDEFDGDYSNNLALISIEYGVCIKVHLVDSTFFSTLPSTQVWSHAMYYRLLAYENLHGESDRVLYLDGDVVCAGDISELQYLEFNGSIAAVVDDLPKTRDFSINRLGELLLDRSHYFNSGVMLVNLNLWNNNDLTNKSLDLLLSDANNVVIKYPDQDALNILLSGEIILLNRKYNTIYSLKSELKDKTHKKYTSILTKDSVFIHYTGITKPWHSWANYPSRSIFMKAWNMSPWKAQPMLSSDSLHEMQKEYKHLLGQGKYLSGLLALFRYKIKKHF